MPTLICVPLFVEDIDSALQDAAEAKRLGADLVEWRIDLIFSGAAGDESHDFESAQIERLVAESPLPCIVTCRPTWEGGEYDGDDIERIALYEHLGTGDTPPRYIDVELAAYTRSRNLRQKVNLAVEHPSQLRDVHTSLILSTHDFNARPAVLSRRLLAMHDEPAASVLKVAYRARSLRDNLELFELLGQRDRPMIALGMGEFGLMSRVLAPKFGAFLTFATLREAEVTAPGQPTISDLLERYRFRSVSPSTRVYGIIGWPVAHSKGPIIHNAGFEEVAHDGVYLPLPVGVGEDGSEGAYESFKGTTLALIDDPRLDFAGASVTLPHKEHLARLAIERGWSLDAAASATGAANTIVIDGPNAPPRVMNTDAGAIGACLSSRLGAMDGKQVTLLGAGGVARAAAHACSSSGAHVTICARTDSRAEELASELTQSPGAMAVRPWSERSRTRCDVLVNCTPVGMAGGPAPEESPADLASLRKESPDLLVFDTVYAPLETPLLAKARMLGLGTIDGGEMFIMQAAAQFEAWTGTTAPVKLFDRLVRNNPR